MKVSACPKCGSKNIYQGTTGDGVLTGYTTKDVCRDCGYQGNPILFDSEKEYKKFLEEIKEENDIKEEKIMKERKENINFKLSKKEKEVIEFLNELADEEPDIDRTINKKEEIIKDEETRRMKNPITTLGAGLIIAGILITAATFGMWLFYTGALILVGFILIIVGFISPKEQILQDERSIKPLIAGILLMMGGLLGLFFALFFLYLDISVVYPYLTQQDGQSYYYTAEQLRSLYTTCGTIGIIFSIFPILGGILAIKRRLWTITILCGILGLFTLSGSIFSLIGIILIAMSKKEFK